MNNLIQLFNLKDIRLIIFHMLEDVAIYMLRLCSKDFKKFTKAKHRVNRICMKIAIENKSLSYVNFVIGNDIDYEFTHKEIVDIIKTNDINFISSLVDISIHSSIIKTNILDIMNGCSTDVFFYLSKGNIVEFLKYVSYIWRIDIINVLESMKIDMYSYIKDDLNARVPRHMRNLSFLKYLKKKNHSFTFNDIFMRNFCNDLEYATWVLDNIPETINSKLTIFYNILHVTIENFSYNKEVMFLLYDRGFDISDIIYQIAYSNDMLHRIRESDRIHTISINSVKKDSSNNMFNINEIIAHCNTLKSQCTVLYYMTKYDRLDLFQVRWFKECCDIENTIILSKKLKLETVIEYNLNLRDVQMKNILEVDYSIYDSVGNDPEIMEIYSKSFEINKNKLINIYKRGLIDFCYYIINNTKSNHYKLSQLSEDNIIYICKIRDSKLYSILLDDIDTISHIVFKIFKLKDLLNMGLLSRDNIMLHISDILRYGDNDIINYVLNIIDPKLCDLEAVKLSNPLLAEHISKIVHNRK